MFLQVAKRSPTAGSNQAQVHPARTAHTWRTLAQQLPASLRFGGSTWSYPGWADLVWDGDYDPSTLSKHGLEAYHQHPLLRTVCIDRSFWRPLTADQYTTYASQLDDDFRFVIKCPALITDAQIRSEKGKARAANPHFLDPDQAVEQFVTPAVTGLGTRLGVLVFQLSPLPLGWLNRPQALLSRLDRMLAAVRQALTAQSLGIIAVEVRDPELLNQALEPERPIWPIRLRRCTEEASTFRYDPKRGSAHAHRAGAHHPRHYGCGATRLCDHQQ